MISVLNPAKDISKLISAFKLQGLYPAARDQKKKEMKKKKPDWESRPQHKKKDNKGEEAFSVIMALKAEPTETVGEEKKRKS